MCLYLVKIVFKSHQITLYVRAFTSIRSQMEGKSIHEVSDYKINAFYEITAVVHTFENCCGFVG